MRNEPKSEHEKELLRLLIKGDLEIETGQGMIWRGIPRRISFSTPEGEVKGIAPVKFIAV